MTSGTVQTAQCLRGFSREGKRDAVQEAGGAERWEALLESSGSFWGLGMAGEGMLWGLLNNPFPPTLLRLCSSSGPRPLVGMGRNLVTGAGMPGFWASEISRHRTAASPSVQKLGFRLPMYKRGTPVPVSGQGTKAVGWLMLTVTWVLGA